MFSWLNVRLCCTLPTIATPMTVGAEVPSASAVVPRNGVQGELEAWCIHNGLPKELVDRFTEEALTTVDDVLELSSQDIDKLCEGFKLGIKTRLKLVVKRSANAHYYLQN
mmetsp:Transcript_47020/g.83347  ORF Transcript_47020/g.83347 Transcript_47020/m.83347 type:complete len:110 (+) Transcript_47020:3-332(+)